MPYPQARDREQLRRLRGAVDEFIFRCQSNPSTTRRKTIILFPGGMASQFVRATTPYEGSPQFSYDTVWLGCSVLCGAALRLKMQGDMDLEHRFVIPDGCVNARFLGLTPYEDFIRWCEHNGLDWFVFGWDWRRRMDDTADFFLTHFLPMFQQRVVAACGVDPLQDYALIGHSMGGMVLKLILNRGGAYLDKMSHAVTVATPFYGHAGQVHRYFKGDSHLNYLNGTSEVTEAVSSMPGGYELLFLDKDTYDRDRIALECDQYPLSSYPSVDADNNSIAADPYNPQTNNGQVRYPQRHGFDHAKLQYAKQTYERVAAPLNNPALNRKFYNIRGVRVIRGTTANDTINSQIWAWIPPNFDADSDADPITDTTVCPGDGVIPAWSARLVTAEPANVVTIGDDLEHSDIMNFPGTQDALAGIFNLTSISRKRRVRRATPKLATPRELLNFLTGLAETREEYVGRPQLEQAQATQRYLEKFERAKLRELMRRAYVDALKSPSQKLGTDISDNQQFRLLGREDRSLSGRTLELLPLLLRREKHLLCPAV